MFVLERFNKTDKYIAALVFLFPIAGIGVRHWFSGIATILVLFGIFMLISKSIQLKNPFSEYSRDEKIFSLLVASLFFAYLVSGFVNGWNDNQLDYFAGELNFLLFVPLYFAISQSKITPDLIIKGTIIAGIVLLSSYFYDIYVVKETRVTGVYGYLFSGPVAVMYLFITVSSLKYFSRDKFWTIWIYISILSSLFIAVMSESGTAYSLIFLMCLVAPFIVTKRLKSLFIVYLSLVLILIGSFFVSDKIRKGVLRVTDSAELFVSVDDLTKYKDPLGTSGDRMAMWVSSWVIFKDNVFFGVGRGNFNQSVREYANKNLVRSDMVSYSHPHNIYFSILVSKGLLGISVFIMLIIYIFKMYFSARNKNLLYSESAILHLFAILLVGIGSEGPILKNNFISIFLVYTAVYYSYFSSELRKLDNNSS